MSDLPADLPPVLSDALRTMPGQYADQFLAHLRDGTSADWLSDWLSRYGSPVSATTLKRARSRLVSA